MNKERLVMGVGLALSVALIFYFLRRVDLHQLGTTLISVNLWILSFCLITKGLVFSLGALRSRVFLKPLHRYRFIECFAAWLAGDVTNNLFPFRLGELVRIDLLARTGGVSRRSTVAVVALERLLDLGSFMMLAATAVPLLAPDLSGDSRLAWGFGAAIGAFLLVVWLVTDPSRFPGVVAFFSRPFNRSVQAWLFESAQRFVDGFSALRSGRAVVEALALTISMRLVALLTIQCWLWAFGIDLPWYAPLIVIVFVSVGTMVPSSPGFIGTYHVACAYALELMGVEPAMAASVAIAGHFMATVPWTVIGVAVTFPTIRSFWKRGSRPSGPAESVLGT